VLARKGIDVDLEVRPYAMCPACGPVQGDRVWKRSARRFSGHLIGEYGLERGAYYYVCGICWQPAKPIAQPIAPGIDWSKPMTYVRDGRPNRKRYTPYVQNTRDRIQAGLDALGGEPFVALSRNHGTFVHLDGPVPAVTGQGNHHMLVKPGSCGTVDGCQVRMFGTSEKAYAQRFAPDYRFYPNPGRQEDL
jgi:DNA (cytosine-5)-methyltransferase 1